MNFVFICCNNLLSSLVERVITGTYNSYNLGPVIASVALVGLLIPATSGYESGSAFIVALLVNTQFADYAKVNDTSQLMKGISSVFKKLLGYFNSIEISKFFAVSIPSNFPVTPRLIVF